MNRDELLAELAQGKLHYDESPVWGTKLNDLSREAFAAYHEAQFGLPLAEQLEQSRLSLEQYHASGT